jgi:mRNA interferase HigB
MSAWHKIAEDVSWANWGELKQTFGTADKVGNCTVFDVGNNHFRVIGRVFFDKHRLYILDVMDHEEYDKKDKKGRQRWIERCGCHNPPPPPDPAKTKQTAVKKAGPRKPKGRD